MIWVKGFFAGLAALLLAALAAGYLWLESAPTHVTHVYAGTLLSLWWLPTAALAIFAGGFYWSFDAAAAE